jgi:hypothetical protein
LIKEHSAEYNIALRKAVEETLDLLGERGKRIVISVLESRSLYSRYDSHIDISLEKISQGLSELFGDDTAELIMESVLVRMDRICCQLPRKENNRDSRGTTA